MSPVDANFLLMAAMQDQDRMEAEQWLRGAGDGDVVAVWDCIQRKYADPEMEIMSRFAQLGMTEMILRLKKLDEERKDGDI